ncbi:unnamed protein product, partial [Didymodactylos carnosus]
MNSQNTTCVLNLNHKKLYLKNSIEKLSIQKRTCDVFTAQELDGLAKELCECNRWHDEHELCRKKDNQAWLLETPKWKWETHTACLPTDAYGLLKGSNAPYIRCDIQTNPDKLALVMFDVWKMFKPHLIMCIIGGFGSTMNVQLEKEFIQGITDAALSSSKVSYTFIDQKQLFTYLDGWLITNGYKDEIVPRLVGEAIYKNKLKNLRVDMNGQNEKSNKEIYAVGVSKWANVKHRNELVTTVSQEEKDYRLKKKIGNQELEQHHTQFILLDDGSLNPSDVGRYRSQLARTISSGAHRAIPLVTIVVAGGLHTLCTIFDDLLAKTPVLVIDGTGAIADLLSKFLKRGEEAEVKGIRLTNEDDEVDWKLLDDDASESDKWTDMINKELQKKLLQEFKSQIGEIRQELRKIYEIEELNKMRSYKKLISGSLQPAQERYLQQMVFRFMYCLQNKNEIRSNIKVFSFNKNNNNTLYDLIYETYVQARENLADKNSKPLSTEDQLRVALKWSHAQAATESLNEHMKNNTDPEQRRKVFIKALLQAKPAFVDNFLKLRFDLQKTLVVKMEVQLLQTERPKKLHNGWKWKSVSHSFLNQYEFNYLEELFRKSKSDQLYKLDKIVPSSKLSRLDYLNDALKYLIGDYMVPLYTSETITLPVEFLSIAPISSVQEHQQDCREEKASGNKNDVLLEYISRDLFLWSILTHRMDMAKLFLSNMKTRICAALVASKILRTICKKVYDNEARNKLELEAEDFETFAIECLKCCYDDDKEYACELVIRKIELFGGITCLQVAAAADNKKFLHEETCQTLLTNIWYDRIEPLREKYVFYFNLITFNLLHSITQSDTHDVNTNNQDMIAEGKSTAKRLNEIGINYTDDYGKDSTWWQRVRHFHWSPVAKYSYNCIGYLWFLLIFSYFMLFNFDPISSVGYKIHWTEVLTILTITTMLVEDLQQFILQDSRRLGKFKTYFDFNNQLSNLAIVLPAYILFYAGLALRFIYGDVNSFSTARATLLLCARIVLAYDLELWFIRSLLFVGVAQDLGPKLVMIRKMVRVSFHRAPSIGLLPFAEMIAADEERTESEWLEFESYSTNDYVRRLNGSDSLSSTEIPSRQEVDLLTEDQTKGTTLQLATLSDKIDILNTEINSLRTSSERHKVHSENMNKSLTWIVNAIDRVKMSKDAPPVLHDPNSSVIDNVGQKGKYTVHLFGDKINKALFDNNSRQKLRIIMCNEYDNSGPLILNESCQKGSKDEAEVDQQEYIFHVESMYLGDLEKIKIMDNEISGVERIIVADRKTKKNYYFYCGTTINQDIPEMGLALPSRNTISSSAEF